MKINLSRINLNLLVALDALLQEQHVTRAGKRLHITQSAMSNLLKQLREVFQDELFMRGQASSMIPTPRALALAKPVREALQKAEIVFIRPEQFNPQTAKYTFTIGMSDYAEFVLLPSLIQHIAKLAPGIELIIKHVNYINDEQIFENSEIDFVIGIFPKIPQNLFAEKLFTEESVCLGCKKNPLLKKPLTLKSFANAKQIVISYFENRAELLSEQILLKHGLKRHAVATVPHTIASLYSLPETDLITLVLQRVARKICKHLPLAMQSVPFTYHEIKVNMVWHPKNRNSSAHQWLAEQIRAIVKRC